MNLTIPPVIVTLICGGLMWTFDRYLHTGWLNFDIALWVTVVFCSTGGIFGLLGLVQFYRHSTSIDPHKPDKASDLVTDGIYGISRNPMYVGLLFILAGWGFYLENLLTLLVLPLFVEYMNRFQIIPEEKAMEEKFGDEYLRYKNEVRRWL
jgi:protein-S-isoprenylcysteine O-methyltransferase Ste14